MTIVIAADDLTGANATAARFARRGLRAVTLAAPASLQRYADRFDVVAVSTASRELPADRACARVREVLEAAGGAACDLVVKRIDSTLRGNVGAELETALSTLSSTLSSTPAVAGAGPGGYRALVVPAFPSSGRTTVGGLQLVDGVPLHGTPAGRELPAGQPAGLPSARVADVIGAQTDLPVAEVHLDTVRSGTGALTEALRGPAPVVVCDATDDAHLRRIAAAAAEVRRLDGVSWLAVDPGPFGVELAGALGLLHRDHHATRPVLVVAGSVTAATSAQLADAERVCGARFVDVAVRDLDVDDLTRRLAVVAGGTAHDGVVGVRTARRATDVVAGDPGLSERVTRGLGAVTRRLVDRGLVGGLYVTGGEVAAGVLAALDAHGLEADHEVIPLAVAGRLVGGPADGLPVVTKGGLVGGPSAASLCIQHLRAAARHSRLGVRAIPEPQPEGDSSHGEHAQ